MPIACAHIQRALAVFVSDSNDFCISVISSDLSDKHFTLIDREAPLEGFKIQDSKAPMEAEFRCSSNDIDIKVRVEGNTIITEGNAACGTLNDPAKFYADNKYILSLLYMTAGILLMLFGMQKWNIFKDGFSFLFGIIFTYAVYWIYLSYRQTNSSYFMVTLLALVVGGLLAYATKDKELHNVLLLTFATGFFIAHLLLITVKCRGGNVI